MSIEAQIEAIDSQRGRILVVDDDRIIVEILRQSLALAGYEVDSAADGVEGLELARRAAPDLILLDVMMPRLDGYSVCQQLKADPATELIPVIILTALTDRDDKLRALEVGADEFIRKPPDRQELLVRIRSLLRAKKLHDQLLSSYQSLRDLQQAKRDLITMIVHDMRGPLGSIVSSVELLRAGSQAISPDKREVLLASSLLSLQQISTMMETMLDVQLFESGQMRLEMQPVVLRQVIDECVQAVQPLLQVDRVQIDSKTDHPDSAVMMDRELVTRVLNNLLFNAIRFSPAGGRIGVWTQFTDKWVIVNVADQGPGIPPDQRESVFHRSAITRSQRRGGGVGLGLSFCKMAVEAMGGRIWVEETPRAGALFRFALPMAQSPE